LASASKENRDESRIEYGKACQLLLAGYAGDDKVARWCADVLNS